MQFDAYWLVITNRELSARTRSTNEYPSSRASKVVLNFPRRGPLVYMSFRARAVSTQRTSHPNHPQRCACGPIIADRARISYARAQKSTHLWLCESFSLASPTHTGICCILFTRLYLSTPHEASKPNIHFITALCFFPRPAAVSQPQNYT